MSQQTEVQAQLADEQLDRLELLLEDPALSDGMRLDQIQGYLCAALAGPQAMPAEEWLINALGSEAALASAAGSEAAALLRRFAAVLESELASGTPPVLLLYAKEEETGDEDSGSDYRSWCQAYLHGVDAASDDWFVFLGEDEAQSDSDDNEEIAFLDERLFPLLLLTGDAEAAARSHGEDWPVGDELRQMEDDSEAELSQAVVDIYRFWVVKRGTGTQRRETPKIGRNDPCPCGSGKKFKQCCGAA